MIERPASNRDSQGLNVGFSIVYCNCRWFLCSRAIARSPCQPLGRAKISKSDSELCKDEVCNSGLGTALGKWIRAFVKALAANTESLEQLIGLA